MTNTERHLQQLADELLLNDRFEASKACAAAIVALGALEVLVSSGSIHGSLTDTETGQRVTAHQIAEDALHAAQEVDAPEPPTPIVTPTAPVRERVTVLRSVLQAIGLAR